MVAVRRHAACRDCERLSEVSVSKQRPACAPPLIADIQPPLDQEGRKCRVSMSSFQVFSSVLLRCFKLSGLLINGQCMSEALTSQ